MEKIILRIFIAEQSLKKWRRGLTDSTPLFHFIVYLSYGSLFFQKNSSPSSLGSFANTLIFVLTNTNNFFSYCACPIWDVSHFTPLSPISFTISIALFQFPWEKFTMHFHFLLAKFTVLFQDLYAMLKLITRTAKNNFLTTF